MRRAALRRTHHYHEVSWWAVSLFGVIVVAFYLTVIIRLGTWGECARKGYHSCIVRAYPVFDEKIYQDPLRACACNTLVFVDTRCLTKSNELVNATSTPFASEVLNSSAILNPTVSLFIGTCQADGELLYTIAAHARQLSVLAVSELPNTRQFEAPGNKSRTVGWEIPATFGSMAGEMAAWWPMQSLCFSRLSIGTIPSSIGMLSSLRSIRIDHTDFRGGTIPAFLSEMTNLVELFLNYNRLSGTIPASLGILTCTYGEHALSTLDVSSCRCHHIVVTLDVTLIVIMCTSMTSFLICCHFFFVPLCSSPTLIQRCTRSNSKATRSVVRSPHLWEDSP